MYVDNEMFKNQDIVKMHAYKDAIANTIGSYIIYPGRFDVPYYESDLRFKSVGAFGLIPGENKTTKIREFIKKLIIMIK